MCFYLTAVNKNVYRIDDSRVKLIHFSMGLAVSIVHPHKFIYDMLSSKDKADLNGHMRWNCLQSLQSRTDDRITSQDFWQCLKKATTLRNEVSHVSSVVHTFIYTRFKQSNGFECTFCR